LLGKGRFGNLWSFLFYFQFAFKYMYLWSSDGVSFLDESTMYDISFQTHELRVPEISQLIDQSIDGGIYVSLITACCGPGGCVWRANFSWFFAGPSHLNININTTTSFTPPLQHATEQSARLKPSREIRHRHAFFSFWSLNLSPAAVTIALLAGWWRPARWYRPL
jgi:hypothetical protein